MTISPSFIIKRFRRNFLVQIAFALMIMFGFGCKKEKVVQAQCSFLSPSDGQGFAYSDTVPVAVDVQSNFSIERVDVQVSSNAQAVSLPIQSFYPNVESTTINCDYLLNDSYMESGIYFVEVTIISNGESFRYDRNFTYSGLVKQLEGIVYLSAPGANMVNINQLDFNSPVLLSSIGSDYVGSSLSSRSKVINILGSTAGLSGIDANDYSTRFHFQPAGTGTISSVAYSFDKEINYIGCSDGNIQGVNELGQRQFQTGSNQFLQLKHVLKGADFLLADFYKTATMEYKIGSFFYPSGTARNELAIDFEIVSILPLDAQNVRIYGNRNLHGLIYDYSIPNNTITLKRDQNGITYRSAVSIVNGDLILTDLGIWTYSDSQGAVNVSQHDAFAGTYDDVNNVVYCYSAHKIYELQAGSFLEMNQLTVSDSVLNVHLVYNK